MDDDNFWQKRGTPKKEIMISFEISIYYRILREMAYYLLSLKLVESMSSLKEKV